MRLSDSSKPFRNNCLQLLSTEGAEVVGLVDFGIATGTTTVVGFLLGLVDEGGGDDTCGYSDDGVAEQHDKR